LDEAVGNTNTFGIALTAPAIEKAKRVVKALHPVDPPPPPFTRVIEYQPPLPLEELDDDDEEEEIRRQVRGA